MKKEYTCLTQAIFVSLLIISLFGSTVLLPLVKNLSNSNLSTQSSNWTFMVYMDGDNNLDSYGDTNINQMEAGYLNTMASHVNVIVLQDHEGATAHTYQIRQDNDLNTINSPVLTTGFPSDPNMGSKTTLKNFIVYCFNNFPADHYVLTLWDHGGGIFGICWDDTSGNDKLTFTEVKEAIAESCSAAGKTIDILALDACLMQMFETSYEWHQYVKYIVASEETIPGQGFPYEAIINDLCTSYLLYASNPGSFASKMVDEYFNSYDSSEDITLSNIDVQAASFNNLKGAFNLFTDALKERLLSSELEKSQIASARAATQQFYYKSFIDLYDFALKAKNRLTDPYFKHTADLLMGNITGYLTSAVKNSKQYNNPGAHGLSIYFPQAKKDYDSGYSALIDLGHETNWGLFLDTFYNGPVYSLGLYGYQYNDSKLISSKNDNDGIPDQGETVNVSIAIKNTGTQLALKVNGTLTCFNENITVLVNFKDYGDITAGAFNQTKFQLNINPSTPIRSVIPIFYLINATFTPPSSMTNYHLNNTLYLIVNLTTITAGDSFDSAVSISQGYASSFLPGPSPIDASAWFKITVPKDKYLICSILYANPGTDFDAYIYRPSGALLTAALMSGYPDICSTYAPETGDYRLRVYPYIGKGAYTLNITISDHPGPEDGLSFGTAITLPVNMTAPYTVKNHVPRTETKKGYMFYRIFMSRGNIIKVDLNADPSTTDFDLILADNNFASVDSSTGTTYPEHLEYAARYDGYYYIIVVPSSGKGDFTLTVAFQQGFVLNTWIIILIIIIVVIAVIVGLIIFFKIAR